MLRWSRAGCPECESVCVLRRGEQAAGVGALGRSLCPAAEADPAGWAHGQIGHGEAVPGSKEMPGLSQLLSASCRLAPVRSCWTCRRGKECSVIGPVRSFLWPKCDRDTWWFSAVHRYASSQKWSHQGTAMHCVSWVWHSWLRMTTTQILTGPKKS